MSLPYPYLNALPQIWQSETQNWRSLTGAEQTTPLGVDLYPRMFVLPDGRLFKAGPDQDTWFLDTSGNGKWTQGPTHINGLRTYGTAVMYSPGKILVVGGGRVDSPDTDPNDDAVVTAEVIDFTAPNPQWRNIAPMQFARRQLNATILPDGKVLVTGGTGGPGFSNEANPVLAAEVWNPETEDWTTLESMQITRGYHSTAVLLPDGRVLSSGGGQGAGATIVHNDAELFSPPYLFNGTRPTIQNAEDALVYGQSFVIESPDAASITKVSLIRLPSVTHSFDNQRFVNLGFTVTATGLSVQAPALATVAPPGHYMLFILNGNGVPSIGKIVQILPTGTPLIKEFDAAVVYTENNSPVVLDSNVIVSDSDSTNLSTGKLTIRLINGSEITDRLEIRNQGNGAGQIGVNGFNVTIGGVVIGSFSGGVGATPLMVTLNSNATPLSVQSLLRNITFRSISDNPTTDNRMVRVALTDGTGNTSNQPTKMINVAAVNDAPAITFFDTAITYTENGVGLIIDTDVMISDVDSTNIDTGALKVQLINNGQSTDRLEIRNQGVAPGQIGVSGANVTFGGGLIGTFTAGAGTTALVVTFNSSATLPAVQAVLRNITYRSLSENPSMTARVVRVTLSDGDGGTSNLPTKTINVVAVNDDPAVTLFDTAITFNENGPNLVLDTDVIVADPDSANVDTGTLTVQLINNGQGTDRLEIRNQGVAAGQIGVNGSDITFGGVLIGTFTGGTGTTALVVTFNVSATPTTVQHVLRNITFRSLSENPLTAARVVRVTVTDGDGGTSNLPTKTINVTAVNDAPVITLFDAAITYTENGVGQVLDINTGVTDVDSANFDTGKLTVQLINNGQSTDRLEIRHQGVTAG
ncbi:MAG: DUF1929 domain-containing protein, partial [Planctomycetes bacterium]|nr:DUF1929 domain-containing protein [Planctomycetota bacterium]